jgi:hypothetical protein
MMGAKILDFTIAPKIMAAFHLSQVALWTAMIPIALFTGLKTSVPFLVMISILALVFAEMAAWQGALGERRQDEGDDYGQQA